ncbi:Melanoma antigen, family [Nesidiocoris tenuis]|uniref:Melanoma antigen, family n=1 Tax=Nesidiocoris tenuis TaxID=355587 RepID=A0ABN7AVJ6_9HEMI|nr:Melanoma antigen, family [Nesidiocoris tenuis]
MSRRRPRADEWDDNSLSQSRTRRGRSNEYASQPVASASRQRNTSFASQATGSRKSKNDIDPEQMEKVIKEDSYSVVMNALNLSSSGKSFKRSDLLLGCRYTHRRADLDSVIELAEDHLQKTYGFQLVQAGPKFFLSAKKSNRFLEELADRSGNQSPQYSSFLGVVLTLIFLQKGEVEEDFLMNSMLLRLFPDIKTNPHPFFGNVEKLFVEMEQQLYISKEKQVREGETRTFYRWGPRSNVEFNKRTLVTPLLTAMFGQSIPDAVWSDSDAQPDNTVIAE